MRIEFTGRVALVQGGSTGMGRAIALALGKAGASVIVGARDRERCQQVAASIVAAGGTAVALPVDVTDAASLEHQFAAIQQQFGRLDYAVNNVGATLGQSPTHETPPERFTKTIDINLTGTFRCMQHEIALMLQGAGGAIVNTSSIGGTRGFAGIQDYCAAKWGLIGLTKSAALEYATQGIRLNVIAPGLIATEKFEAARVEFRAVIDARLAEIPLKHPGDVRDIANTVLWLLSPQAAFITGAVIPVDGGECAQ